MDPKIIIGISLFLLACTANKGVDEPDTALLEIKSEKEVTPYSSSNQLTENLLSTSGWEIDSIESFDKKYRIYYIMEIPTIDSPEFQKIIDLRITELKKIAQKRASGKLENLSKELENDQELLKMELERSFSLDLHPQYIHEDSTWVSMRFYSSWNEGGMHGLPEYITINYNKTTNSEVPFEEYFQFNSFTDSMRLVWLINMKLSNTEGFKNTEASISKVYPIKFNLKEDSISFNFDAYELGSYGLGMPRVNLSKNELGRLINENYR